MVGVQLTGLAVVVSYLFWAKKKKKKIKDKKKKGIHIGVNNVIIIIPNRQACIVHYLNLLRRT